MPSYTRETLELHGSAPDLIPADAPAVVWNQTNNIYFKDGETRRVAGDFPTMGTPLTEPRTICFYTAANGTPYWVYAGAGGIFVTDGVLHTNITPASGWTPEATGIYTSFSFNGFVVINCSSEVPVYWNGNPASICLPLPGWPAAWRCLAMRPHKWFLMAIGRLDAGGFQRVNWSDAAEAGVMPDEWNPTASNMAGFVDILPSHSPCIDGITLRDSFLVFKGQSVSTLDFVGGNDVFRARRLFNGIGLAGVNGITEGPSDQCLFLGSDGDWYKTDGVSHVSVVEGLAQRTLYAEMEEDVIGSLASVTLTRENISWLFYPSKGSATADRAICYSWQTQEVGFRDAPLVRCAAAGRLLSDATLKNNWDNAGGNWNNDPNVWNFTLSGATGEDVVAGCVGPKLVAFENPDIGAPPLPAYAFKSGLSFGDAQTRKLAKALWPKLRGTIGDTLMIRFGGQDTPNGPITWANAQPFVIGGGSPVEGFVEGRYLAIEVVADAGLPWALTSIDVEFRGVGQW